MRFQQSIRWRIQAWHGALLLGVVTACCVTSYRLQETNALRHSDSELDLRLSTLTGLLGRGAPPGQPPPRREPPPPRDGEPPEVAPGPPPDRAEEYPGRPGEPPPGRDGPPPRRENGPRRDMFQTQQLESLFTAQDALPFYFIVWSRNGSLLAQSANAPENVSRPEASRTPTMAKAVRNRDDLRESYAFTPPGECLLVGQSTTAFKGEMRDLAWKLAGLGFGVLLLGLAGGWLLASRAMRPISEISAAAAHIAAGNLAERIQTSETESELGRLAAVLNETFQRLDAAFAQQARFTSDAAHELRTPVSIILGQTQLALARERSADEHRATIETCQRAAKRMHGLIESLLQLSMLDGSREPLEKKPCDLAELSREHLEMMRPLADEKHIELEGDLEPAPCSADAERISQILVNLLGNALKFSCPGDRIRVSTHRENGGAILSVLDTGPGISAEHLPHLFERFYRAEGSRNRVTGGAGLGLAICKSIADAHGGQLTVESAVNKGTTFTLRIPAGGVPAALVLQNG